MGAESGYVARGAAWLALSVAVGGFILVLQACLESVEGGVETAVIVDGREPHSLLVELFTDAGQGTLIRADEA